MPNKSVANSSVTAAGAASQQFCVRWNSHLGSLGAAFPQLLAGQRFVDVTLACEGHQLHCHKLVLAACSSYFESLLGENLCKHPIIILPRDIKLWEIQALIDFMYKGEVNVSQAGLADLLKCAEILQIRGLSGSDGAINLNHIRTEPTPTTPIPTIQLPITTTTTTSTPNSDKNIGLIATPTTPLASIQPTPLPSSSLPKNNLPKVSINSSLTATPSTSSVANNENDFLPQLADVAAAVAAATNVTDLHNSFKGRSNNNINSISSNNNKQNHINGLLNAAVAIQQHHELLQQQQNKILATSRGLEIFGNNKNHNDFNVNKRSIENSFNRAVATVVAASSSSLNLNNKINYSNSLSTTTTNSMEASSSNAMSSSEPNKDVKKDDENFSAPDIIPKTEPIDSIFNDTLDDNSIGKIEGDDSDYMEISGRSQDDDYPLSLSNVMCEYDSNGLQITNDNLPGRRVRRSETILRQAAECVSKGQTFQTVSDMFNIPISTIRFFMARKGILPRRKRGRSAGCSMIGNLSQSLTAELLSVAAAAAGTNVNSMIRSSNYSNRQSTSSELNDRKDIIDTVKTRTPSPTEPPFHFANYKLPELTAKLL